MHRVSLAAVAAFFVSASVGAAGTIDFSEFSNGQFIGSASDGSGITATISATSDGADHPELPLAQVFDTSLSPTSDPDLEFPGEDFGNVLIIPENNPLSTVDRPNDDGAGGTITLMFSETINFLGFTALDADSAGQAITATAAGGFSSGPIVNGDGLFTVVDGFSVLTDFITFSFGGSGAIDNIIIREDPPAVIPLPAPALMLLSGILGFGVFRRRQKHA